MIKKERTNDIEWFNVMTGVAVTVMLIQHLDRGSSVLWDLLFHLIALTFFYLAGYSYSTIKERNLTKRQHFIQRTKRHLIFYFSYSFVLLLIHMIIWQFVDHTLSINRVVNAIGGVFYARAGVYYPYFDSPNQIYPFQISNGALWFIPAMIIGEGILLIYIKLKTCKKNGLDLLLILGLIASGVALKGFGILLPWSMDVAPFVSLIMITGYEIAPVNLIHKEKIGRTTIVVSLLSIALYIFMVVADPGFNLSIREYGNFSYSMTFSLLCGVLGCIILGEICKVISKVRGFSILGWIGKNAVPIIGLHYLIINLFPRIAGKTTSELSVLEAIALLFGMIVVLGSVSVIIKRIIRLKNNHFTCFEII